MSTPSLVDCLKLVSAAANGVFAGGALYINLVEQPSRVDLPARYQRQQWKNSFTLAAPRLPIFGFIGTAASTALYFLDETNDTEMARLWLLPLVSFILGGVWTATMMLPDIKLLLDEGCVEKKGDGWVKDAISTWTKRHTMRTLLDFTAFGCVLYICIMGK